MRSRPIVIWGASGHARVVADIVRRCGGYEIVGFIDDFAPGGREGGLGGAPVLGDRSRLPELRRRGVESLVVAVGDNRARRMLGAAAAAFGFALPVLVHPAAVVADDVVLGAGTVVMAGAVINPGAVLEELVIVNTGAGIDHDCRIAAGVHVGPGAHLAGDVRLGRGAWVGIGACVIEKVTIGAGAVIGAGAAVVRDIPAGVLALGVPARVVKTLPPERRGDDDSWSGEEQS